MKKLITVLVLFVGFANLTKAQIKLGLKIAPQLTLVSTESKGISSSGVSFNMPYGLMVDYYFTENYAFATEFSIAGYSGNLTAKNVDVIRAGVTATSQDVKYDYNLRYISVPLLIRMRTKEIGYWRYFAEFGLDNNFLIKSVADVSSNSFSLSDVNINNPDKADEFTIKSNGKNISDDVSFYRGALVIGLGAQYNVFGNTLLVGSVRYNNAFTNFTQDDEWKARMHGIALNIGVLF